MIKGVSRRVIVVESPDAKLFEKAIFILRENRSGVSYEQFVKEAQRSAGGYMRQLDASDRRRFRAPPPLYAALGAAAAAVVWAAYNVIW